MSDSAITDALTQSSASPVEANSQPKSDAHVGVGATRRGRAFSASCSAIALRISNLDIIFGAGGYQMRMNRPERDPRTIRSSQRRQRILLVKENGAQCRSNEKIVFVKRCCEHRRPYAGLLITVSKIVMSENSRDLHAHVL